jgi:hypothetical protein
MSESGNNKMEVTSQGGGSAGNVKPAPTNESPSVGALGPGVEWDPVKGEFVQRGSMQFGTVNTDQVSEAHLMGALKSLNIEKP